VICCPLFSKWNTVFKRLRDWMKTDVLKRLFDAVSDEPDMEYATVVDHCQGPPPWPRRKRET
jgi:hypothetical protein